MTSTRRAHIARSAQPLTRWALALSAATSWSCAQDGHSAPACAVTSVPAELEADAYYEKYCEAEGGLPVLTSAVVSDEALVAAGAMAARLLGGRPTLRDGLVAAGSRIVLLGEHEHLLDVPEADASIGLEDRENYRVLRGVALNDHDPPIAIAPEENVLCWPTSDASGARSNTLLHELGHLIHLVALKDVQRESARVPFGEEVLEAYTSAMEEGLWTDTYAAKNEVEYWAEGVVLYFTGPMGPNPTGNHAGVDSREGLREHDPALFELLRWAFGEEDWYPACPRRTPAPLAGRSCKAQDPGDDVTSFSLRGFSGTSVSGTAHLPGELEQVRSVTVWVKGTRDNGEVLSEVSGQPLAPGTTEFRYRIENVPPGEYLIKMAIHVGDLGSESLVIATYGGEGEGSYANAVRIASTPRCAVDLTTFGPIESDE